MPDVPDAERRGCLTGAATGQSTLLVLRRGVLRIFPDVAPKAKHTGLPEESLQLVHKSEVSSEAGGCIIVRTAVPYESEHSFKAASENEAKLWLQALEASRVDGVERMQKHLQFLEQGSTAYKYNYSNSKRMRRHFWVDPDRAELRWGKARGDEAPQAMDLKSCVGIIYGAMTSTFQRCEAMEDPPWACFSLLFPDRTLDMAVAGDVIPHWFLGMQYLLLQCSVGCITCLSEAQFAFRKVLYKLRHAAHREGLTTRVFLARRIRKVVTDPCGVAAASDGDAGAGKASSERRSTTSASGSRRPTHGRSPESSPVGSPMASSPGASSFGGDSTTARRRTSVHGSGGLSFSPMARTTAADGPSEAEGAQEDLKRLASELERQLQAAQTRLEAVKPKYEDLRGAPPLADIFKEAVSLEGVAWQADKCCDLEEELITLKIASGTAQRQLQAAERLEKQLKRLAKQYKDCEAQVQTMEQELGSAKAGARSADSAKHMAKDGLALAEAKTGHLERRLRELEQQLGQASAGAGAELAVIREQNQQQVEKLDSINAEKEELSKTMQTVKAEVEAIERRRKENEQKLQACQGLSQNLVGLLRGLYAAVTSLRTSHVEVKTSTRDDFRSIADDLLPLTNAVNKVGAQRVGLEQRYREIAEERRKLHNIVLELKGNIRVFVRCRPMNEKEKAGETAGESTITFAEDTKMSVFEANAARRKWFEFDKVFPPKCNQPEVFEEVKPLATSVLDGYNVCIFAYGQTGSGKTFTMTGNKENPGLNVRVLTELFRIRDERRLELDINISLMISEIYNETIKDLFVTKQKKLDVKQNPDGSNSVPGLTELPVDSVEAVLTAMTEASSNRTVMATDMNEESSRSHSIVQVKTACRSKKTNKEYVGKINLIDLAGSENVNKSGVSGQGMKEAQNINKSLSALGDVIQALVAKTPHVPYRNSKLTMMLKDSLGGDCKTLMIVQCSPAQTNVIETLSSLNFAARARNVELGKAKRNVKGAD